MYISTYIDGVRIYVRARARVLVYPRFSYTAVSQNELDISRAREKSLNTRYTVYAITDVPPNFGLFPSGRYVTRARALSQRRSVVSLLDDDNDDDGYFTVRALRQFSFGSFAFSFGHRTRINSNGESRNVIVRASLAALGP